MLDAEAGFDLEDDIHPDGDEGAEPRPDWISDHAVKRIRQRLGLPKRAAQREAERALEGAHVRHFTGSFRRYLDYLRHLHGVGAHYRITRSAIFAFKYGNLATVFPVPPKHRKSANAQMERLLKRADANLAEAETS
ncbi:hypothetical protein [Roseivivax sp. CAU 1761]